MIIELAAGGFAVVYKGIVVKGVVAVKKLSRTSDLPETKFHREVECLVKAKHKNIVRFLGHCSEVQQRADYLEGKFIMADIRNWLLCFEYVPNGSLNKYITDATCGLEWRARYKIIKGICEGLVYLHQEKILHLDLKPGNILVDEYMVPKITDFGLSRCLDIGQTHDLTSNLCGTLGYFPLEYYGGQVAKTSDIYSLGVIIVEILTGMKGYPEDEKVVDNWMNRLEGSDQWDVQLEQVRVCIKIGVECMDLNPKKRPVARHIFDRLDETTSTVETGISSSSVKQQVVENWMNQLEGSDQRDTLLEQARVCTKIGMECMDSDPKKEPDASYIVDRLEKTSSSVETGISSSSVEQQVSFLKDQYCQGEIAKLSPEYLGKDINEHAETEELGEYVGTPRKDHWQQGQADALGDQWSLWEAQYAKQNVIPEGASISSSNSGLLYKLNSLDVFNKKARNNYLRHGGQTLEMVDNLTLFQKGELKPFLNDKYFIRKDGFGDVYKALVGAQWVTVRKARSGTVVSNRYFLNEVIIQSRVIHKNIVRLIGCCLESDVPMLVHEFVARGSIHDILHRSKEPLNLDQSINIAAESAHGLAYMHSRTHTPILHSYVKPGNILLDEDYRPKISDFGILWMIGECYDHTGRFNGDMAYMDSVYLQTSLLTEKRDVYSFAVFILELLTRKKATHTDSYSLVRKFLENHWQRRKSTELFDKEIAVTEELDFLDEVAEIAVKCLNFDRDLRPTMTEVAEHLSVLSKSRER